MADGHDHLHLFGGWIRASWYWLAAAAPAMYYSAKWAIKQKAQTFKSRHHPTYEEMEQCRDKLTQSLFEHEQAEFERYDRGQEEMTSMISSYRAENLEQHKAIQEHVIRVDGKIDNLTRDILRHFGK